MEFISVVELIGTVAFAVSGALAAIEKELDYYGIAFLAIITAVGGGIIRDVLIDERLPVALENPLYVLISIGSAALVIFFYKRIIQYKNILQIFDAVGLAAFTAIGAEVAILNRLEMPFIIITLALLTGTGGGVLRDVFTKEIPFVFRKEIYAVASIVGAVCFIIIGEFSGNTTIALYACFGVTLLLRLGCMRKDIHLRKVNREEVGI
ncbi:MAG: trimeric intracellular cation channel family protein [Eubacteriales bacterium]|nr:trimeric intracellular cation channel family protein [Eubacteriales bacterium]